MDKAELNILLGKIGKQIFVKYFREFGDSEKISNQEMIALLPNEYTFNSRKSRTAKARRIFRERLEEQALSIIVESSRVDEEVVINARA